MVITLDVNKRHDDFLRKIYFHLGGDTTVWETDIHAISREWGYRDDEIDSFLDHWETKQCIEVTRALGAKTVAVRLTPDGFKCVRDVLLL